MSLIYKPPKKLQFIQSRAAVDFNTVDEYVQMMRDGVIFEPVQGLQDEYGTIWVWDGYHRGEAAKRLGRGLSVYVEKGDRLAAEWRALTANQRHGLRRTNTDKQRVIELALKHPNGAGLSDSQIAKHCGVSDKTVARVRRELEATSEIPKSNVRTGADGRAINTINIGRVSGPSYTPIARLEGEIRSYLVERGLTGLEQRIVHLSEIKDRTPAGREAYGRLLEAPQLTQPFRPGDVWQACNNLLEQSRQQQRAENPTQREVTKHTERLIERGDLPKDYDSEANRLEAIPLREQVQSQQFTCPNCRQRTVKFNGKTLCLNPSCGASWEQREEYLVELDSSTFRDLTVDFTDMTVEDIERDLAALESDGYGHFEMAIRLRAEIAARTLPAPDQSADRAVTFLTGQPPERPQLLDTVHVAVGAHIATRMRGSELDKEHRGWLKAQFADAVNRLPADRYTEFVDDMELVLQKFGLLNRRIPRR